MSTAATNGKAMVASTEGGQADRPPKPTVRYREGWPDRIPAKMKARRQWVLWRYEWDGKSWTKVPYQPHAPVCKASHAKQGTWNTFDAAVKAWRREPDEIDGIGYVFSAADPYCGVDFDHCIGPDGEVADWAAKYLAPLRDAWGDISPSGTGVKFIVEAALPDKGTRRNGFGPDGSGAIEVYDRLRFFTVCGNPFGDSLEVLDRQDYIDGLYAGLKARPGNRKRARVAPDPVEPLNLSDEELLAKARGFKNGEKFSALYDRGELNGHKSESEADFALLCHLAWLTRKDADRMDRLWLASALGKRGKVRDRPDDYRKPSIENAINVTDSVYDPGAKSRLKVNGRSRAVGGGPSAVGGGKPKPRTVDDMTPEELEAMADEGMREIAEDDRPEIEITVERHEVVEKVVEALTVAPDLYSRGGALVSVVVEEDEVAGLAGGVRMANAKGTPRICVLPESVIGCLMTRHAKFYVWAKDKNGEDKSKDCHPPSWLIKAVAEKGQWRGVRPLAAIAGAPFIRADGSVVQRPGYDAATGTLYRPSIDFPDIPDEPSHQDARDAAKRLLAVVDQFPFASEDDAAVWLSGLLTAVARQAIGGPVPGIALIGNRAGCGKGLLIDVIGNAVWGSNVPTFCYPYDNAEASKVKVAIALEGIPAVHFDNLDEGSTYGNPALDSALTSTIIQDRILGSSKTTGRIALRPCWWLSGNNNVPAKDAYRRWLPCNISTALERPEEREDIKVRDLRSHVAEKRGEIVRDALVILKAHADAGYPGIGKPPLGSFEDWDRIVRGAVWFATGRDCCATRRKAADESPERLDKLALLEGWRELPGGSATGGGVTAEGAIQEVANNPAGFETLRAFFARKSRDGKPPTARQIGNLIRGMQGSKFGGLHFEKAGDHKRSILWRVAGTPESPPDSPIGGESGESSESNHRPPENGAGCVNISSLGPLRSGDDGDQTRQTHQTHRYDPVDPDDDNWR